MSDRCADTEPLHSAWLDGMLEPAEEARLARHLRRCGDCRRDVDGLARTRALLRNLPVRRFPGDLVASEVPAQRRPNKPGRSAMTAPQPRRRRQRAAAGLAVTVGMLGGVAFALGGEPAPDERVVSVPVDVFVADHLIHTVGGPISTPVLVE